MTSRVPPVIPHRPKIRMPSPETASRALQGPPVISQGTMPMPSPAPAGSTPFVGPGLSTCAAAIPPPGQTMTAGVSFAPSPSCEPVPMAMAMASSSLGAGAVQGVPKFNGTRSTRACGATRRARCCTRSCTLPRCTCSMCASSSIMGRASRRIRQCERVDQIQVTVISADLPEYTRWDWGTVALCTVSRFFIFRFFMGFFFGRFCWLIVRACWGGL
jgi:hypothetical protein